MALLTGGKFRSVGVFGEEGTYGYMFWCPGCESPHHVTTKESKHGKTVWGFNGNLEAATFTPSLLVYGHKKDDGSILHPRCHSFITDGKIQFLGDCEHALANQTVDIPLWPVNPNWCDDHDADKGYPQGDSK